MLSALIRSRLRYPAMRLAAQPVNQRSVQHGPLVLVSEPRKFHTPTIDRDRTVSRRSEPSSRATLMGEQPNPWDLLQPQDDEPTSRCQTTCRYELWEGSACYPRSTFYPLSDVLPYGNTGSLCSSFLPARLVCSSQAPLCHYTLRTVTDRPEGTFRSLRYAFGGDHPSQTTHQAMSFYPEVRTQTNEGSYFNSGSTNTGVPDSLPPTYPTHRVPKFNAKL